MKTNMPVKNNTNFPNDPGCFRAMAQQAVDSVLGCKGFRAFFSSTECEDLVSDVVVRMLVALDSYDPEKGIPEQWIWVIARNLVYSEAKKKKRQRTCFGNVSDCEADDDFAFGTARIDEFGTDRQLLAEETREACFARLKSEKDKQLLRLKLDGFKNDEIAEIMGLTRSQLNMRVFHLRRRLHDAA